MKKCLPITLLVSLLCFGAGCTPKQSSTSSTGGTTPTSSSVAPKVTVSSVEIEYDGETTVLAGSTAKLKAEAKMSDGSKGKVEWSTSDENIAKVNNGIVSFKNVLEDSTVTITATSKEDSSKSASVTFEVKFTAINFANSRGNFDSSLYLEENSVIVEKGDSALLFNEVHGTKWYVEADVTPSTDIGTENDQYPKFGIMTGTDANGYWNTECKNLFYFVDAQHPATANSWTSIGFVGQNDTNSDWNWGSVQGGAVSAENKFAKEETTKMGLMRDGIHYYLFAGRGEGYGVVKHIINDHFGDDEATYAWFGGWQTAYTLSNATYLIGDEVDAKYEAVSTITLSSYEQTLYINDTYQIDYKVDTDMYNPSKLTFTSADPEVASVTQTGLVTAGGAAGKTTITIAYEDVKAEFDVEVTTDALFKVELDGQMNDLLWNENVKTNKLTHKTGDSSVTMDLYASRNSKGLYLFADYYTKVDHSGASDWWKGDNFELRFNSPTAVLTNDTEPENNKHQYWISRYNSGAHSNMSSHFITAPVLNEETGYYEIKFEAFISYAKASIDAETLVGLTIGFNPGGSAWTAGENFATNDFFKTFKITQNGIVRHYEESVHCSEGHEYGDWSVVTNASCAADGLRHRFCKWCNYEETEVLPKGEHDFSEPMEVITPATCQNVGVGHVGCTACDAHDEVEIPVDLGNHTAWDATAGECTDCHSILEKTTVTDSTGGWNSTANNIVFDGTAAWSLTAVFDCKRSGEGWGNQFVAEIFSPSWSNGGWTYRSDWCGWGPWSDGGNATYTDVNGQGVWDDYFAGSMNMHVVMTVSWDPAADTIVVDMTYTSLSRPDYPVVEDVIYTCKNVTYEGNMHMAFGADLATLTTYAIYTTGTRV